MADARVASAVPDEFAQRGSWRAFRDPSVEASYREWHREQIVPLARFVGFGSMLLWFLVPVWFNLVVGDVPRVLILGVFAVGIPTFAVILLASFISSLRPHTNAVITAGVIAIGLDIAWCMGSMYGMSSGTVACGVLVVIFYPLIIRLPAGAAAVSTAVLSAVPVVLVADGVRGGATSWADSWPYLASVVSGMPVVVVAAAVVEASMRQQFVTERQLKATRQLLRRYAPAAVADRIESGDAAAVGHPQRLRVTAMSSDVAGFTSLADRIDPESLSQIVNEYVATMSGVVESQGGVITEFAGDGLMAIFGAPERLEPVDQVRQALAAATAMHARLAELSETWFHLGIEQPLKVRIGINTGMLSVGTFGSGGRATYTAIGLQMNVAARIQAQCEPGSTLLSSASWHLVKDEVDCEPLGEVMVKGIHFPISIHAPRVATAG